MKTTRKNNIVSEEGKPKAIEECKEKFLKKIQKVENTEDLEALRIKYLGRKGEIRKLFGKIQKYRTRKKRIVRILHQRVKNHY